MVTADCNCRGGQAIPIARFGTIPPVCYAYIPKGHRVPKSLKGCIIKYGKPSIVG